jgi:hypothetical protein
MLFHHRLLLVILRYITIGYWWLLYLWLLMAISLVVISGYFIVAIDGNYIGGYW